MRRIEWRHTHELDSGEPQVWLDVAKVEACFRQSGSLYVGPGGSQTETQSRYAIIDHIIRSTGGAWMPHVNLDEEEISFTDGRHRFAWARDHGATAILVTTSDEDFERLSALYGSDVRESRVDF